MGLVEVIDNFYDDVDAVRQFALSQPFDRPGNYPGRRTENFIDNELKDRIQTILFPHSGDVIDWNVETGFTGSYQLTTSKNKSWIHTDKSGNWGGVLYLTPDAPLSGGTGFYKSKLDGSYIENDNFIELATLDAEANDEWDNNKIYSNMDKWELVNKVENVYNRLILFRSNHWHSSLEYFGKDHEDGRLTQVFFIRTEH